MCPTYKKTQRELDAYRSVELPGAVEVIVNDRCIFKVPLQVQICLYGICFLESFEGHYHLIYSLPDVQKID